LFGRRAHRKLPVIEDVGQLQSVFGAHLPKGELTRAGSGTNSRRRVFTVDVTFWAFLFQVLWPSCGCREVVRKVQACWRGRKAFAAGSAASCMARARLPLAMLEGRFATLATTLERRLLDGERWLGERHVKILDGTGLSMPDTPANQKRWPQPGAQKPGCGFPVLRLAGLFCMGSGALLRYAFGNKHNQENHLARGVLDGLNQGDVLLTDRGFCSYGLIGVLLARGVDCVMRLHQKRSHDAPPGQPLRPGDRLVEWTRPRDPRRNDPRRNDPWAPQRPTLPATRAVRLVSFRIEVPGFRTEAITLATTLLDAQRYPAQALAELYRARWSIELRYREVKTTMGADILRCKSPAMIEKELCLHAIAYNLLRCVMQEAAQRHDVELARLSFKGALDAVRHFADALHAARGKPRRARQILRPTALSSRQRHPAAAPQPPRTPRPKTTPQAIPTPQPTPPTNARNPSQKPPSRRGPSGA